MMCHKEAAAGTACTTHEQEQGYFGVHETLQMSGLQMLTSRIPSMEILMSDLYINMQLTKPRHLSVAGFFPSFLSIPTACCKAEVFLLETRILQNSNLSPAELLGNLSVLVAV